MTKLPHKLCKQMSFMAPLWPRLLTDCKSFLWIQSEQSFYFHTPTVHIKNMLRVAWTLAWSYVPMFVLQVYRYSVLGDVCMRMPTIRKKFKHLPPNRQYFSLKFFIYSPAWKLHFTFISSIRPVRYHPGKTL